MQAAIRPSGGENSSGSAVLGAVAGVLALVAAFAVWWVTRDGVSCAMDSLRYVSAARNFSATGQLLALDDHGQPAPLDHFPPLYPLTLALLGRGLGDAETAARWLGVVLLPVNLALLALVARRSGITVGATAVILGLFAFFPPMLQAHISAMSDALGLALGLTETLLLLEYQQQRTWKFLVAAALVAGAGVLTRYAAVALIVSGAFFAVAWTTGSRARRLGAGAMFIVIGLAPLICWQTWDGHASFGADRMVAFNGVTMGEWRALGNSLEQWFAPLRFVPASAFPRLRAHSAQELVRAQGWSLGLAALALIGLLVAKRNQARPDGAREPFVASPAALFACNLLAYEAVVFLSGLFLDPNQDFGTRMQLPAFGWALLLGGVYWTRRMCGRVAAAGIGARGLAFAVIALLLGGYALAFAAWVRSAPTLNLGYHSASWRRSEALARIRQDYPHTPIFTYDAPAIYFQLGRTDFVQAPPRTLDAAGQRPNPDFERQMTLLLGDLAARHGVFVYFKRNAPNLPPLAELEADPNLRPAGETKDAVFFLPVSKPN